MSDVTTPRERALGTDPGRSGANAAAVWSLDQARFRYRGAEREAVAGVTATIRSGRLTAILGPNGAGKSTLVQLLLGMLRPSAGTVTFRGRPAHRWDRAAMARAVGFVPQGEEAVFPLAVRDVVAMGRYPHLGPWRRAGAVDQAAVERALELVGATAFAERLVGTLSGGERQRVRLARALAQEADVLVLDEPTAALDVRHEMEVFELLHALGADGRTLVVVTHNLNLAARYADEIVLLADGRVAASGAPAAVLTADRVSAVYGWPVIVTTYPDGGAHAGAPVVLPLARGRGTPR